MDEPSKKKNNKEKRSDIVVKELTPEQLVIFRYDAERNFTSTAAEIAKALGYNDKYIGLMRALPQYKFKMHHIQQTAIAVLEDAQLEAAQTLRKLLKSHDENIQLAAAATILKPIQEGQKRIALIRAAAEAFKDQNKSKEEIVYVAEWGSTSEPDTHDSKKDEQ